jgi:competence protein ComEA
MPASNGRGCSGEPGAGAEAAAPTGPDVEAAGQTGPDADAVGWVPEAGPTRPLGADRRPAAGGPVALTPVDVLSGESAAAGPTPADVLSAAPVDRRPSTRAAWLPTGLRIVPAARAVAGLVVVAVLGALLGGSFLWRGRPEAVPVPMPSPSAAAPVGSVVVHVAGLVARPGVVTVPLGARVTDAVRAAGGPVRGADTGAVNLARPVVDGEQIVVPSRSTGRPVTPATGPGGGSGGPAGGSGGPAPPAGAGQRLDLNAATPEQLQELPGVGPVLAQRILEWRQANGRFSTVEELREVDGIGERRFAELADRVRV